MRKRIKKRPGQSLIEVVLSIVITAMTTVAVFSVVLSTSVSQKKTDKKEAAAMVLKQAHQTLQLFVSAVPSEPDYSFNSGLWPADARGEWALTAGEHDISALLAVPPNPVGYPLTGGTLTYFVTNYDCLKIESPPGVTVTNTNSTTCKKVVFTLTYPDN